MDRTETFWFNHKKDDNRKLNEYLFGKECTGTGVPEYEILRNAAWFQRFCIINQTVKKILQLSRRLTKLTLLPHHDFIHKLYLI